MIPINTLNKMSLAAKGRIPTLEQRIKMSEAKKGKKRGPYKKKEIINGAN